MADNSTPCSNLKVTLVHGDSKAEALYNEAKRLIAECAASGSVAPLWCRNFVRLIEFRQPINKMQEH